MLQHRHLLWAILGLEAITAVPTAAMPPFIGLYVDQFHYSLGLAGRISSVEAIGMAVGQLIAAAWFARPGMNLRTGALIALLLFALAQIFSLWPQHEGLFAAARFLSGTAGGGLVFSIVGLYIASLPQPDRAYSLFYGMLFVVGPLGLFLLPRLFAHVDPSAIYVGLTVATLLALPILRVLPREREEAARGAANGAAHSRPWKSAVVWLLAGSLFANYLGNGGVWVYMERIGNALAIATDTRGLYLAIGMSSGLLGTAAALALAGKIKRLHAAIAGNLILLAGYLVLTGAATPTHYLLGAIMQSMAVTFVTPFYLSALARTDTAGRNATLGLLAFGLGYGAGPGFLSLFATDNFHMLLFVAAATAMLAVLLVIAAATIERRRGLADTRAVLS